MSSKFKFICKSTRFVPNAQQQNSQMPPQKKKKSSKKVQPKGTVRLRWTYRPSEAGKDASLKLTVVEAKDLAAADKSGTSDPFVALKLGKEKKYSKPIKKTLNPIWNESFEFRVPAGQAQSFQVLYVKVYDWNLIERKTFLGIFKVDLSEYPSNEEQEMVFPLTAKAAGRADDGISLGIVHLKVSHFPPERGLDGKFEIDLVEASEIISKDESGLSDPFFTLTLGQQKLKSKIEKQTLSPSYNQHFKMKIPDDKKEHLMEITCWDWDATSGNDFIGKCLIDPNSFEPRQKYDVWFKLGPDDVNEPSKPTIMERIVSETERKKEEDKVKLFKHFATEDVPLKTRIAALALQHEKPLILLYRTITAQRPRDFAIYVTLLTLYFSFLSWLGVKLLSILFLFACALLWLWLLSDIIYVQIDWNSVLGPDAKINEADAFLKYVSQKFKSFFDDFAQQATEKSMLFTLKWIGVAAIVGVVAFFLGTIFAIFVVIGLLASPVILYSSFKKSPAFETVLFEAQQQEKHEKKKKSN